MNRRQRKKKSKAQQLTIILGCKVAARAEEYEKMRKSIDYQLRAGSVILLPAYLHVEAIIQQNGGYFPFQLVSFPYLCYNEK